MASRGVDSVSGRLGLQAGELLPSGALTVSWEEQGRTVRRGNSFIVPLLRACWAVGAGCDSLLLSPSLHHYHLSGSEGFSTFPKTTELLNGGDGAGASISIRQIPAPRQAWVGGQGEGCFRLSPGAGGTISQTPPAR